MSKRPKAIETISYGRNLLWVFGLYHSKRLQKHSLYIVNRTIFLIIFYLLPLLILLQVFQSDFDFMSFLQRSSFFTTTFWGANKSVLHIYYMDKLHVIEDELETDIFNVQTKEQDRFMREAKTKATLVLKYFWYFLYAFASLFISYPLISGYFFTIPIWNPFRSELFPYVYQCCYFATGAFVYPLLDTVSVGLIFVLAAEYKILKDNLRNICKGNGKDSCAAPENEIQERLRKCIIHHNAILKLSSKIEDLLSPTLFGQIAFSVLQLCFTGIQVIGATETAQIGFFIVWLMGLIWVIFLISWCGQEIINESCDITDACYTCEWYSCTPSTKKLLLIIMANTQKPVIFYAGKLFTICFSTFTMILRSAYSYYALFSQIYQK